MAQDFIRKFTEIPNITADYDLTGCMAAEHFLAKGFKNFGFFGYNGVCWSDERCEGFRKRIAKAGFGDNFHMYDKQNIDSMWFFVLRTAVSMMDRSCRDDVFEETNN